MKSKQNKVDKSRISLPIAFDDTYKNDCKYEKTGFDLVQNLYFIFSFY